jgi:hypothetical protein
LFKAFAFDGFTISSPPSSAYFISTTFAPTSTAPAVIPAMANDKLMTRLSHLSDKASGLFLHAFDACNLFLGALRRHIGHRSFRLKSAGGDAFSSYVNLRP